MQKEIFKQDFLGISFFDVVAVVVVQLQQRADPMYSLLGGSNDNVLVQNRFSKTSCQP